MDEKAGLSLADLVVHTGDFFKSYFQCLHENSAIFVAVSMDEEQKVRVYFEHDEVNSICRVFLTPEDVISYLDTLALTDEARQVVRFWGTTPKDFTEFLVTTGAAFAAQKNKKVTALATVRVKNILVPVDIFWSNDQRFMV